MGENGPVLAARNELTLALAILGAIITTLVAIPIRDDRKKAKVGFLGILTGIVISTSAYNAYQLKKEDEQQSEKQHKREQEELQRLAQSALRHPLPPGLPQSPYRQALRRPGRDRSAKPAVPIKIVDMSARGGVEIGSPSSGPKDPQTPC